METLSKEQILKQARIFENYQGNESDILGAEKGGKFHGFIAGAEWAIEKMEADKAELLHFMKFFVQSVEDEDFVMVNNTDEDIVDNLLSKFNSLIQKMKQ